MLIRSEHKYTDNSGYASFWASNPETVVLKEGDDVGMDFRNVIDVTFRNHNLARKACHCANVC